MTNIINKVKNLYDYFENNNIDLDVNFLELDTESDVFKSLFSFNNEVMKEDISENDINQIIKFLDKRTDNLKIFIIEILLTNNSFFKNEEVKNKFYQQLEDKIFDDIDEYNLSGDKNKIIDLFYNRKFPEIKNLINVLSDNDKKDVLKYIIEHSYEKDIVDNETDVNIFLNNYIPLIEEAYSEDNFFNLGEEYDDENFQ